MKTNALVGELAAVVGTIDPEEHPPGTFTVTTEWANSGRFQHMLALVKAGVIDAASTVDAKLEQAQDAAGTGVKDIAGKAITQLAGTDDDKQAQINLRASELDIDQGFGFVRLSITATVAALEVATADGTLVGFSPVYSPIDTDALGIVDEIVD